MKEIKKLGSAKALGSVKRLGKPDTREIPNEKLHDRLMDDAKKTEYVLNESMSTVQGRLDWESDAGYIAVLVFQNSEQKRAFVKSMGRPELEVYLDGRVVARKLAVKIPPTPEGMMREAKAKVKPRFAERSRSFADHPGSVPPQSNGPELSPEAAGEFDEPDDE